MLRRKPLIVNCNTTATVFVEYGDNAAATMMMGCICATASVIALATGSAVKAIFGKPENKPEKKVKGKKGDDHVSINNVNHVHFPENPDLEGKEDDLPVL